MMALLPGAHVHCLHHWLAPLMSCYPFRFIWFRLAGLADYVQIIGCPTDSKGYIQDLERDLV